MPLPLVMSGGDVRILIVTKRRTVDLSVEPTGHPAPDPIEPRGDVYASTERAPDYADPELDARRPVGFHPTSRELSDGTQTLH